MGVKQLKYLGTAPLVLKFLQFLLVEAGMSHPWWDKMPWDILVPASIGATLMILIQDFSDPNTWIRRLWRHLFSKFEIEQVFADPRHVNGDGDPDRIVLVANIRYKRRIKNSEILIYATNNSVKKIKRELVARVPNGNREKDEIQRKFPILVRHIPRPNWTPRHDAFGIDDGYVGNKEKPENCWISPCFKGRVEIVIEGQSKSIYLNTHPMRNTANTGIHIYDLQDATFAYGSPMVKLKQSKSPIKAIENYDHT